MDSTLRATLLIVTKTAETLGVPLPAGCAAQLAKARGIVTGARKFSEVSIEQVNVAVIDAIEAGRDVHADKTVQRLMFDRNLFLGGIEIAADQRDKQISHAAVVDYADDILTSWAEALTPHTEFMAAAAEALPDLNLSNLDTTLDVEGMQHTANTQIAINMWAAAIRGFNALLSTARVPFDGHTRPLIITPDIGFIEFASVREAAKREQTEITPWLLTRHGVPIELATVTGYTERVERYEEQREAVQQELADRRRVAGFGASHGATTLL